MSHFGAIAVNYVAVALLLYVGGDIVWPEQTRGNELGAVPLVLWLLLPLHDVIGRRVSPAFRTSRLEPIGPAEGWSGWMWDALCGRTFRHVVRVGWLVGALLLVDVIAAWLAVLSRAHVHRWECAVAGGALWTLTVGLAALVRRNGWQRVTASLVKTEPGQENFGT